MYKIAMTLSLLALLTVGAVWSADDVSNTEANLPAASEMLSTSPDSETCTTSEPIASSEAASLSFDFLTEALTPSTSFNCNGCVEPSYCTNSAQCGYPQGVCIQNSCRCICDPFVW